MASIPEPPAQLKSIQSFIKIANDIEKRDPVVAYWIRMYSLETALKIDKNSPECKKFLRDILICLENFKQSHKTEDRVTNETVGQAHFENYVMNIFNMADTLDRNGEGSKKVASMFFMATMLFETMSVFGNLSEELQQRSKYAKFKAAYILKCIKSGQTPKPGPIDNADLDGDLSNAPAEFKSETKSQPPIDQQPYILTPSSQPPSKNISTSEESHTSPLVLPETPDRDKVGSGRSGNNSFSSDISNQSGIDSKPTITATKFQATNGNPLKIDDLVKCQKYCKFATSALQYDDVNTAVVNLEKALRLLKTGEHSD